MAWQVGSACYPSEVAAASAQASAMGGAVVNHGPSAFVVGVESVGSASITYTFSPVDGGTPLTLVAPFHPVPCQLLDWADGLQLGWLVAAAWLGVVGVMFISRALIGDHDVRNHS